MGRHGKFEQDFGSLQIKVKNHWCRGKIAKRNDDTGKKRFEVDDLSYGMG